MLFDSSSYNDPVTMSNRCKQDCIDKNQNFCPTSSGKGGFCCSLTETCPKSTVCSEDNPRAPKMFKYFACPNEAACESKYIYPPLNGEVITRQVDQYKNQMVNSDVCSYVVEAPSGMNETDKLIVTIDHISNAIVYLAKGKGYMWLNHLDYLVNDGDTFNTRMGWNFYIIGVGSSVLRGTFRIKAWVEKGTADKVLNPVTNQPEPEKKEEPVVQPVEVNQTTTNQTDVNTTASNVTTNTSTSNVTESNVTAQNTTKVNQTELLANATAEAEAEQKS